MWFLSGIVCYRESVTKKIQQTQKRNYRTALGTVKQTRNPDVEWQPLSSSPRVFVRDNFLNEAALNGRK